MGGLDLLPPAKAAAKRGRSPLRTVLLVVAAVGLVGYVAFSSSSASPVVDTQAMEQATVDVSPPSAAAAPVVVASEPPPTPLISPSPPPPPPAREVISLKLQTANKPLTLNLRLLPEHSESSVAFMRHAATTSCAGELYRSEKDFLVQGRINCNGASVPKVVKGGCPAGAAVEKSRACPSHDPQCGCHGPIMSKGMVGWAGGSAGPDLFIYTAHMDPKRCAVGACPATHWSRDHTVFAEVADEATWDALNELYTLPVKRSGMTFFADKIGLQVGWSAA